MKKLLLVGLFAVAGVGFLNAQNTYQPPTNCNPCEPPVRWCCHRESDLRLNMRISKILCLYPPREYACWINFDCYDDFYRNHNWYDLSDGNTDFTYYTWSNVVYNVGVRALTPNFVRTTPALPGAYNAFPAANVEWRVRNVGVFEGPALTNPANYNTNWKIMSTAVVPDNAIANAPNGSHAFNLNFRTRTPLLHPATSYMPGNYYLDVKITATED